MRSDEESGCTMFFLLMIYFFFSVITWKNFAKVITWSEGPLQGNTEGLETSIGACEVAKKVLVEGCLIETAQEICRKSGFFNAAAHRRTFSFCNAIYCGLQGAWALTDDCW